MQRPTEENKVKKKSKSKKRGKSGKSEKAQIKALVRLKGKPLVVHAVNIAKKFFSEIIVVVKTKKQKSEVEELINNPKVVVIADKLKTHSPIAGIKAGTKIASSEDVFILACDMPFVNGVTIFQMINRMRKGIDCVIPSKSEDGKRRYEPLCAIYKKQFFDKFKVDDSLQSVVRRCRKVMIPIYDDNVFFNINTWEDLEQAKAMMGKKGERKK